MAQNYDVVIIGGGIVGSSIAACLASENLKIAVINSNNLGMPASLAAAGMLTPFQITELGNPLLKDFCFKSFEYFSTFYETINSNTKIDLGFNQPGSLYLIFSVLETSQKEAELKELKKFDSKISFLNKQEVPKLEPLLTKEILGAYHYPSEGYINSPKFLKAISLYCMERKISFLNSEVKEINFVKDKIANLILSTSEIVLAKKYVLCNGAWSNKFLKNILNTNEDIIKAVKGEILQVGVPNELPIQKIILCKEGYILPRPKTNELEHSTLLIGSTYEEVNMEEDIFQNTVSSISFLTNLLQKLLPNCKNYPILNMWSGLRPQTKDKLPVLGKVPEVENLYCALGHYRNGILMGPLTGKILKDLILENTSECNIEPFKIERLLKNLSSEKHGRSLASITNNSHS